MDNSEKRFEFIYNLDLFGKEPNLYFERNKKKTSIIGNIFTILYIILYITFFIFKLIRMIRRVDVIFYDTYAYKDFPSIKLTNEEFYGGFSMGGIIDETLYHATAEFVSGVKIQGNWNYTYQNMEVETCQLKKFGSKYQKLFADQPLEKLYCLKNVNFTLEGYANLDRFSYINVKVFPCVNTTKDGRKCKSYTEILKFFSKNVIEFKMEDNLLSPELYKTPVEPQRKDINAPVFLTVYQKIYSYIQIVYIETDNDITGLNFLSKNKIEQYPKYDNSELIAAPGTADILKTGGAVCDITMQLHQKILTTKRKYTTLLDVLGDVGGLMELIYSVFNLICSFLVETIYDKSLVNNLFSFDLNKKIILLKKNKNLIKNKNSANSFESLKKLEEQNSITILKRNNLEIFNNEIDNKSSHKNVYSTKSKIRKNSNYSSNSNKSNNSNKININNMEPNSNDLYIIHNDNNENEKKLKPGKNLIIDEINVSPIYLLCLKKKNNLDKLLFDNGMKLIAKNLDIVNIFNALYSIEKMKKELNIDEKYIEMNVKFKQKIDNIRHNILIS